MKGKKCIKYLILCITFLLSLNLFSNANAIRNISTNYLRSVEFATFSPRQDYSVTLRYNTLFEVSRWELSQTDTAVTFGILKLNLRNNETITVSKTKRWKTKLYFKVFEYDPNYTLATPQCPTGTSGFIVDNCSYEVTNATNMQTAFYRIVSPNTNDQFNEYFTTNNENQTYYVMTLEGRYNSDNDTEKNQITLTGGNFFMFYSAFKPQAGISNKIDLTILFEPITTFEDDISDVAEKEKEDRENLETQQGETETDAEDSSDSFESNTTNITGVISGFVTSLNNLQVGNCTLPEISAYGFSLGNINLCTFTPPTWIQGVTTVIISLITLGLAWHVFRRIMGIAKSIAGSK